MREVETILEETSVLVDKIKSTVIYTEYQSALEDLQRQPELKALADAFREEKYLAYIALKEPVSFADFDSLEEKRMELASYPEIERYLKAELALCRVLQEVQSKLVLAMSFD
ncbi:MAG: YlbF family regulator [Lachnospiraceae bacterium]|nr:YlbF family regulator [Lachnospiraceae bacterium]